MLLFINSTYHDYSHRVGLLVFTHIIRAEGNAEACMWGPWPDPSLSPGNENCGSLARNEVACPETWNYLVVSTSGRIDNVLCNGPSPAVCSTWSVTGTVYHIVLIFILCHSCACVTLKHHYDNVLHVGKWDTLGKESTTGLCQCGAQRWLICLKGFQQVVFLAKCYPIPPHSYIDASH